MYKITHFLALNFYWFGGECFTEYMCWCGTVDMVLKKGIYFWNYSVNVQFTSSLKERKGAKNEQIVLEWVILLSCNQSLHFFPTA